MSWSAALTQWHHHTEEMTLLKKRYRTVWSTLHLEILQYRPSDHSVYRNFYQELLRGITNFPRRKYWQYSSILSPNILEREGDWYTYDNIFFWEKEEVLELMESAYDPEKEQPFTRPYPKEIMELAHTCLTLSDKSLIRHVPEVYVILYADGNANFCDREQNQISLPEYIRLSVEDMEGVYRITVNFLHVDVYFYKTWKEAPENDFPCIFHVYVYDVINTDLIEEK